MTPSAPENTPLARTLRALRQNRNLSMAAIESETKISRSVISRAEKGTTIPNESTLKALEEALGADKDQLTTLRQNMLKRDGGLAMGYPPLLSAAPLLMLARKFNGSTELVASHSYRRRGDDVVDPLVDAPVMFQAREGRVNDGSEPFTPATLQEQLVVGTLNCAWVPAAVSALLQDSVTRLASLRTRGLPTNWLAFAPAAAVPLADTWEWPHECAVCMLADSDGDREYDRLHNPSGRRPQPRRCSSAAALLEAVSLALGEGRTVLCLVSEPHSTFLAASLQRLAPRPQVKWLERRAVDYNVNYLAEAGQNGLDFVFNNRALPRTPLAGIREVLENVRRITLECDRLGPADLEHLGETLDELPLARVRECLATYGGFELSLSPEILKLLT